MSKAVMFLYGKLERYSPKNTLTIFEIAVQSGKMVTAGDFPFGYLIAPGVLAPVGVFFI
jgi:hypothetical protein